MRNKQFHQAEGAAAKLFGTATLIGLSMGMLAAEPAAGQSSIYVKVDGQKPGLVSSYSTSGGGASSPKTTIASPTVVGSTFKKVDGKTRSSANGITSFSWGTSQLGATGAKAPVATTPPNKASTNY